MSINYIRHIPIFSNDRVGSNTANGSLKVSVEKQKLSLFNNQLSLLVEEIYKKSEQNKENQQLLSVRNR